jgi:hypothetical protein
MDPQHCLLPIGLFFMLCPKPNLQYRYCSNRSYWIPIPNSLNPNRDQYFKWNRILIWFLGFDNQKLYKNTADNFLDLFLIKNFFIYEPERPYMHLSECCWFLISSRWGGGKVGSGRGRGEGAELALLFSPSTLAPLLPPSPSGPRNPIRGFSGS